MSVPGLIADFAGGLNIIITPEELDELPPGSVIYATTPHHDCPMLLVKDLSEKLYLGSPCEWFAFSVKSVEIILMEDTFPALPALLVVRGDDS